jgi:4-diphosphocytidyl-2-C-methyl-D-erythritol kinase
LSTLPFLKKLPLLSFPNCKINLGLRVLQQRADGFHEIQSVFFPVPICDALEIIEDPGNKVGCLFTTSGREISGDPESNLCVRAYRLIRADFPDLPGIRMHLHKVIPMGAGLGGGSSDGVFALNLINRIFQLKLSSEKLKDYALKLGSDCPFFLYNQPAFASGRGELLAPVHLVLAGHRCVLVHPGIHIDTGWAFRKLAESRKGYQESAVDLTTIGDIPFREWRKFLVNDFEEIAEKAHPEIGHIRRELYRRGAYFASMTGSGSAVFGLFNDNRNSEANWNPDWAVHSIGL